MGIETRSIDFKPDFSKGSADYVYDYAEITYNDGNNNITTKIVKNYLDITDVAKQAIQSLQISFIANSVRLFGDTDIFISDDHTCKSTKLFLVPTRNDPYVESVKYKRYNDDYEVTFSGDEFVSWSRSSASYYRTIVITNKPDKATPYEVAIHTADDLYTPLTTESESTKLANENAISSHFNQVRYSNIMNQGDTASNSNLVKYIGETNHPLTSPVFGNVAMDANFNKVFLGFRKVPSTPKKTTYVSSILCEFIDIATENNWQYDFTELGVSKVYLTSPLEDDLFALIDNHILLYNSSAFTMDNLKCDKLNRVIHLEYINEESRGDIDMYISFNLTLTLTTPTVGNTNPVTLHHSGWFPLPWNDQLNLIDKRYLDATGLSVSFVQYTGRENVEFDRENLQVYLPKADNTNGVLAQGPTLYSSTSNEWIVNGRTFDLSLRVNSNTKLMYNGVEVDHIDFSYVFIDDDVYNKAIDTSLGYTTWKKSEDEVYHFHPEDSVYTFSTRDFKANSTSGRIICKILEPNEWDTQDPLEGYPGVIKHVELIHPYLKACVVSRDNLSSYREIDCTRYKSYIMLYCIDSNMSINKCLGEYQFAMTSTLYGRRNYMLRIKEA